MICVHASSRLHFGLLSLGDEEPWTNREGFPILPGRAFGGAGLMVQNPGITLTARTAAHWGAEGPLANRVLAFAHCYAAAIRQQHPSRELPSQHFVVADAAPEHAGLGTGTQLGLAITAALARAWGTEHAASVLARHIGRGLRSAVGVHGFEHGGFLVDAGKRSAGDLAPLAARIAFPEQWRIVLVLPAQKPGLHGSSEKVAFQRLGQKGGGRKQTEALCRIVLMGLVPALIERDFAAFGEALYDFNVRSGEMFAPIQGGVYAGPAITEFVAFVRGLGITGVGQSSWGPSVFAITQDSERAIELSAQIRQRFADARQIVITQACNRGAMIGSGEEAL